MTYKADLSDSSKDNWEAFKESILFDKDEGVFNPCGKLGNCSVTISFMSGKLRLEIVPNETINNSVVDAAGVLVTIDEENCHVDDIMSMAKHAKDIEEAKGSIIKVTRH